jgi:hypothetical protein
MHSGKFYDPFSGADRIVVVWSKGDLVGWCENNTSENDKSVAARFNFLETTRDIPLTIRSV